MSKTLVSILLCAVLLTISQSEGFSANTTNQSFNKAKKVLLKEIYRDQHSTFYCGSEFNDKKEISHTTGYKPKKESKREHRLEWEHIVPAHAFGQSFPEWRDGNPACVDSKGKLFKGRRCSEKINIQFRYMQADMHNLVPAIGEVNGLRSNYSFAMIPGEERVFGTCDMEINEKKAEPPVEVRGNIARTYFYMNDAYPGRGISSKKNRKLFDAWDKEDPVDAWECERQVRIEKTQGDANLFVKSRCEKWALALRLGL